MFVKPCALLAFCLAAVLNISGHAYASTVYTLNIGANNAGTITTDGAIGTLQTNNILDFDIIVADFGGATRITGPQSGANFIHYGVTSTALTATSTGLFFDFASGSPAASNGASLIFQNSNGYLCFNGLSGACSGVPSALSVLVNGIPAHQVFVGNQQIAFASAAAVPGPIVGAGIPGLVMALGGMFAWRRYRALAA